MTRVGEGQELDILVIDLEAAQRKRIRQVFEQAGYAVICAADASAGFTLAIAKMPKVIVCARELAGEDSLKLYQRLRQEPDLVSTYFILLSSKNPTDVFAENLDGFADDIISQQADYRELLARARVGLRMWTMHDQLRRAATTDGLTGLHNHDHFNRILDTEIKRSRRFGHAVSLIMMDVDFFKAVNDTYGHLVGNRTLEELANVLQCAVRDIDSVARFGGEEFTIVLPQATTTMAAQVAERVRSMVQDTLKLDELHHHVVTASFGVADSDDARVTCAADLVDLADRALYVAKKQGRNRVVCADLVGDSDEVGIGIEVTEVEWLRRQLQGLTVRAKDVYMQSVRALLQVLDEKDHYTSRHSLNVAAYCKQLAEQIGSSKSTVKSVYNAALLHDIGKVGVPDRILMKRKPLTSLERLVIDQVPGISSRVVDHLRILEAESLIIRHQREHYDGSGVPAGLSGNQIPVGSRILHVADAFDAMTTDRVYRGHMDIDDAVMEIQRLASTQFDPQVVIALRQLLAVDRSGWQRRIDETADTVEMLSRQKSETPISASSIQL